ncbi:MAG TPA: glycoside hydrolase family 3 C-terminal domain-containing protein [Anaerolineales bacterium]|nr:glycoside hydrolase family 3 C-terminal domain-containing protein [Anaerolineales bacterium]
MATIADLVKDMTLEEKAALCVGAGPWTTLPIERLGIPEMTVTDGPHGVRRSEDVHTFVTKSVPATCFPTAASMASTWNVDLIRKVGEALGEECIALNVDVILGPGANMKRTPLCGRNFEYYSEDPYLAGKMAANFIAGVQSKGVGTSLKHFAANNQETQRSTISSEMDERTLREIYLPAFETAVKEAKPWTVMCSYNKINGTFSAENQRLLTAILRDEWGFEGVVISDWGAVHDRVEALRAGLDLEMPGPRARHLKAVIEAVRSGSLSEAVLDHSVRLLLEIVFRAEGTKKGGSFDVAAHHALARKVASEGMVLLRNNGVLPLKNQRNIAVIGRAAKEAYYQGGGSSHINPTRIDSPFEELQKLAPDAHLTYAEGCRQDETIDQALIDEAARNGRSADVALLYLSLPASKESEGYDRPDLDLTGQQIRLIKALTAIQPKTVVILNNGAPVVMGEWIDGTAAVLEAWMMGQAGGGAIAAVLFGRANPSGRLAESFPAHLADTPAYLNFPGENGRVRYGEGIFIGYRYYDAKQIPVQFPFGHGLSYTQFAYKNPEVSAKTFKDLDGLRVSVDVTNTGQVAGQEVVQVYVHDHKSRLVRPPKELKGFAKVSLAAGATKTVTLNLDFRAFAYYHPSYQQWITEDGEFDILIGASSADIRCSQTVTLQSTLALPSILDRESTLREWLEDPRGMSVLAPLYQQINEQMTANFGGNDREAIGMDPMGFLLDTPLAGLFNFLGDVIPTSPEEMVDGLLAKVHGRAG